MSSRIFAVLTILVISAGSCSRPASQSTAVPQDTPAAVQPAIQISPTGSNAAEPAIASDGNGNLLVAWIEHSGPTANLMLQKFDDASKPVGSAIKVNPDGTNAKSWHGDPPSIAIASDGSIYVGWNRANETKGNDLVLSVSHDGGSTFGGPVKVNDDREPASHGMHSLAVDNSGRLYMAWLDERNVKQPGQASQSGHHEAAEPNSEVYFALSSDGGKTFTANKKLAADACPCCKTTLLTSADGRIYAAWRQVLPGDFRHIAVASSTDGGETFSDRVIVSDDKWQLNACPVSGAALASGDNNSLTVAWYTAGDEGQAGVYTASSNDGGKTFAVRRLVSNDAAPGTPVITGESIVFAAKDTKIEVSGSGQQTALSDALYPAAVRTNDHRYICFVRKSGDKSSVWLARS